MLERRSAEPSRTPKAESIAADLIVVGGGLAGVCCAVTAARAGISVVLVQDRPVLGGNASSEVRMVVLGATASMGNNNRWAREGGVIDEFLLENVYRNPEGNPLISDTILLEMVVAEPNIRLLLNTAVFEVHQQDDTSRAASGDGATAQGIQQHGSDSSRRGRHWRTIQRLRAFCSQNSTMYELSAPLFCDASGDGIVGYLAGAAFRMGAESRDESDEAFAPDQSYGELLGHTIYFYSKDTGRPVRFIRPSFALNDITQISRWERINPADQGCQYWWLEYGGRFDTVHETEAIKWRLWSVVYGIWDYLKNSGKFPEADTLTLEWVGTVPGKRESRRFEGDAMLTQHDVVYRRQHDDAVSYGGWALDLHPADGVYSDRAPCNQWHAKGVYPIPYRCLYSRNIGNLFLAGRLISSSHVAFGSTRVMATCAHNAQAVGMAAALCRRDNLLPADLTQAGHIDRLRLELARAGQYIPGYRLEDPDDLARSADISASSRLQLAELPPDGERLPLDRPRALLLPVSAGPMPAVTFTVDADRPTTLHVQLRQSATPDTFTPEVILAEQRIELAAGEGRQIRAVFDATLDQPRYVFVCLMDNEHVTARGSRAIVTGVNTLMHRGLAEVSEGAIQCPPEDVGVDTFEFWRPVRRMPARDDAPARGQNLAARIDPPLDVFGPANVINGLARPLAGPNAWVATVDDARPRLTLRWPEPRRIDRIELSFDTDRDNPLFSVLFGHPERIMPQCVRRYRILDAEGRVLAERDDNHQTRNTIHLNPAVITNSLHIEPDAPSPHVPAAVVEVRCYG